MTTKSYLTMFGPFLLLLAMLAVGVACSETEPERVSQEQPAVDPDDDDEVVVEEEPVVDDDGFSDWDVDDSTSPGVEESDTMGNGEEAEGFVVGDTVRMGNLVIHLHATRWDEGSEFFNPDPGKRWLVLDIELENEADRSVAISSLLMFDLVDQDNRTRSLALFAETVGSLDGELGAGRKMRGDIAWEVDDGQTHWEFIFSPQVFGFGQAIFDISIDDVEG